MFNFNTFQFLIFHLVIEASALENQGSPFSDLTRRSTDMDEKIEIIRGSNCYITKIERNNLQKLRNNSRKMTTTLLTNIFGKEKLKLMSRTGKGDHETIPKETLKAVESNTFKIISFSFM